MGSFAFMYTRMAGGLRSGGGKPGRNAKIIKESCRPTGIRAGSSTSWSLFPTFNTAHSQGWRVPWWLPGTSLLWKTVWLSSWPRGPRGCRESRVNVNLPSQSSHLTDRICRRFPGIRSGHVTDISTVARWESPGPGRPASFV